MGTCLIPHLLQSEDGKLHTCLQKNKELALRGHHTHTFAPVSFHQAFTPARSPEM